MGLVGTFVVTDGMDGELRLGFARGPVATEAATPALERR